MQTRARPPDMAAHQRQRNQTARIIGAVNMLGNAHAPENHPRLRARKKPRNLADLIRRNAADAFHRLGAEILQMRLLGLPILGIGVDILLIV